MMLQCEEYDSWRLLYSQHKLKRAQRLQPERVLSDYTFTCGASMSDLKLPEGFDVYASIACGEPIEKLYYAVKYPSIVQKILNREYYPVVSYQLGFVTMMLLTYFIQHDNGGMFIVVNNSYFFIILLLYC